MGRREKRLQNTFLSLAPFDCVRAFCFAQPVDLSFLTTEALMTYASLHSGCYQAGLYGRRPFPWLFLQPFQPLNVFELYRQQCLPLRFVLSYYLLPVFNITLKGN